MNWDVVQQGWSFQLPQLSLEACLPALAEFYVTLQQVHWVLNHR